MTVRGRVEISNVQRLLDEITAQLNGGAHELVLDLSGVDYFDSGGGALLIELRHRLEGSGGTLRLAGSTPAIDGFLNLVDQDALAHPVAPPEPRPRSLTTRIGGETFKLLADFRELVDFTGELMLGVRDALRHPTHLRRRETWLYMERTGLD